MFGYKIELKSSGIIHLHFTSHMFHLISMHQIFPHVPHVNSQSHLCTLVHHFCCIYCLIGQIKTICSSRLSEEYFTKQYFIFYHFILFLKNILEWIFARIQSTLNWFYDNDGISVVKARFCGFGNFTSNKKFPTLLKNDNGI